jgi:hypothetical protein
VSGRTVRAGQTINLRARFRDDVGVNSTASGIAVHIFEPDADFLNLAEAHTVSGVPTLLGEGIYEFAFTVPPCGPDGNWTDRWEGVLTCQTVSGIFSFDVVASGLIQQQSCQLFANDLVQVTIASGIQDITGQSSLESEHEFEFMTTTDPSYTNLRKIRLEIGGFLGSTPDDTLQTAILEASLEADVLTFMTTNTNDAMFNHARREYTTCVASSLLLTNLGNLALKAKTLGDLSVQYDTNGIRDALSRARDCMDKWTPQLTAGGGARAAKNPSLVVKGSRDPDRPTVSRSWEPTDRAHIVRKVPAANDRVRKIGERRAKRTYIPKKWW